MNSLASTRSATGSGFTLIELMITIAVVGILLTIAVPAFSQFVVNNRLTSQINDLLADVSYARSEAATRGGRVVVCPSSDGSTCTGSWSSGRIVFADLNNNSARDSTEVILRVTPALTGGNTFALTGIATTDPLVFRSYGGLVGAAQATFKLCSPASATGRQLVISITGRPVATQVACP